MAALLPACRSCGYRVETWLTAAQAIICAPEFCHSRQALRYFVSFPLKCSAFYFDSPHF